ncbi:MAG: carboxypeptidase-like regulatory domain-containing protein [Acidobacteriota bacterium]
MQQPLFVLMLILISVTSISAAGEKSIKGRVITDKGQPIAYAQISLSKFDWDSSNKYEERYFTTDDNGNFEATDLAVADYKISVSAKGYVEPLNPKDSVSRRYRPGDKPTFTLIKGGVITGKVIDLEGNPILNLLVRAIKVKQNDDQDYRSPHQSYYKDLGHHWSSILKTATDDRGIYRIYGLAPGTYLIVAGGNEQNFDLKTTSIYQENVPIYYPSSLGRKNPKQINVISGQEVTGIDIHYRVQQSRSINGTVTASDLSLPHSVSLKLLHASTGNIEATLSPYIKKQDENAIPFSFQDLPDGEYDLAAEGSINEKRVILPLQRILINGVDVNGINLVLPAPPPPALITGKLIVESEPKHKCQNQQSLNFAESIVTSYRYETNNNNEALFEIASDANPDEEGEFILPKPEEGQYQFDVEFPNEDWYTRSITFPRSTATNGFMVKNGEQISGLTISVAQGAAAFKGRIVSAIKGKSLPKHVHVYLIPSEQDQAENITRYNEVHMEKDHTFSFTNIAPGHYLAFAKQIADHKAGEDILTRLIWSKATRVKLREAAEAANTTIELSPCQRINSYKLFFVQEKLSNK